MKNMKRVSKGFTLIELMIVIAIIAILLALAIPAYLDYTIRAKAGEGLSIGASPKLAYSETCQSDPTATAANVGYAFLPAGGTEDYVGNVVLTGDCGTNPVITITLNANIGTAGFDLILTGTMTPNSGQMNWDCTSTAPNQAHVPVDCRA